MSRAVEMLPAVEKVVRRFAVSVSCDPDDCVQAAMVRVCEMLSRQPDVSWDYLWKIVRFTIRTYAYEDNVIRVPMRSEATRLCREPNRAPEPIYYHHFNGDVMGEEMRLLAEGYSKKEICDMLGHSVYSLNKELVDQWRKREGA